MRVICEQVDVAHSERSWEERWCGADAGLITVWTRGRQRALEEPLLAEAAKRGELIVLNWKGGIAQPPKSGRKFGSLEYLASWQGLRGDPLVIEMDSETALTCSRTGVVVTFTSDPKKYGAPSPDEVPAESAQVAVDDLHSGMTAGAETSSTNSHREG